MDVLLLNNTEEAISVIRWQKAVTLLFSGKAEKPYGHNDYIDIKTTNGVFQLPSVLILVKYVRLPFKRINLTKGNLHRRDNHTCQYCGKEELKGEDLTLDHVVPQSKNGRFTWENMVTACRKCNWKKADKSLSESGMSLIRKPFIPSQRMILYIVQNHKHREIWSRWVE